MADGWVDDRSCSRYWWRPDDLGLLPASAMWMVMARRTWSGARRNTGDVGAWLMNGLSVLTTGVVAAGVPSAWIIAGIGDVDGGGKADLVWRETNTGDVGVWLMNGLSTPATGVVGGGGTLCMGHCGYGGSGRR